MRKGEQKIEQMPLYFQSVVEERIKELIWSFSGGTVCCEQTRDTAVPVVDDRRHLPYLLVLNLAASFLLYTVTALVQGGSMYPLVLSPIPADEYL